MAAMEPGSDVHVRAQGRLVIPAALRKPLNLKPGDRLIARRVNDSLLLERRAEAAKEDAQK